MSANTAQKARLLDLVTGVLEMTRDGARDSEEVSKVLQVIKDEPNFGEILLANVEAETESNLLLVPVSIVTVPATTEKFVAQDWFVVNTGRGAPVKISFVENNLLDWFFGKTTLHCRQLMRPSEDGPIIAELGGEVKAEVSLAGMFLLMKRQKNGEDGALLTNGYANIFYIKDFNGVLRTVSVRWGGGGWCVNALSVEHSSKWSNSCCVFSRN